MDYACLTIFHVSCFQFLLPLTIVAVNTHEFILIPEVKFAAKEVIAVAQKILLGKIRYELNFLSLYFL